MLVLGGVALTLEGSFLAQQGHLLSFVLVGGALVLLTVAILALQRGFGSVPPLMGIRSPRTQVFAMAMIFGLLAITAVGTAVWAITGFGWILDIQAAGFAVLQIVVIARLRRSRPLMGRPGSPGGPETGPSLS